MHLLPILAYILCFIIFLKYVKKANLEQQHKFAIGFSCCLAGSILFWMFYKIYLGHFDIKEDLPLHLCNILPFLIPIAVHYRLRWFFGVLYYFILVGTLQAVITPDLKEGYPHYIYFRYWLVHCGLIGLIIYIIVILRWKVHLNDIKNAIIGANAYMIFSLLVNYFTGGNYFFTMAKPTSASLLDYLGPWPWYLLTSQIVMLILFIVFYIPIHYLMRRID